MESNDISICDVGPRYSDLVRNRKKRPAEAAPQKKAEGQPASTSAPATDSLRQSLQDRAKAHLTASAIAFNLECFGDELARRMHYKEHTGMDAIHFFLVEKYRWLPSQVKSLHPAELWWLMREEKNGWVCPGLVKPSEPAPAA